MSGDGMPSDSSVAGGHQASQAEVAREGDLARAAAAGDGQAFASLYETYEKRIYNFCLRLLGGTSDAEDATQEAFLRVFGRLPDLDDTGFNFGAYLFTAARNASYDMIDRRRRTEPVADLPDDGSGHIHRERADADIEPERAAMLSNQQAAVRAANERLPARQREVLALREVEGMSYAEIASTMEMNSNSVAQLISRARTSLRSELHLGLASAVPPASADCERAMPLLAMRQDGELGDPEDRVWLSSHLSGCPGCRLSSEEMAEAGISYRAWAPVAPGLYLFRDTLAKASESIGADWSTVERPGAGSSAGASGSDGGAAAGTSRWRGRTVATLATTLVVGIGAGLFAGQVADSTIDSSDFPRSSAVSSPTRERTSDGGDGGGQGRAGARPQGGTATQPVQPAGSQAPPAPPPAQDTQPAPEDSSQPETTPPATGQPGADTPGDGGGSPVTPPTPPTPSEPPTDPKEPGDPPTTGPPVITNPTLPDRPTRPPSSLPGSPSIRG